MCVPISSSTLITYSYMCYFWNIVIYHKLMWNILHISFCCLRTGWNGYKELELKIKYYFNSWHCKISFSSIGRFLIHTSIGRFWVEVLAQIFPSTYFFLDKSSTYLKWRLFNEAVSLFKNYVSKWETKVVACR